MVGLTKKQLEQNAKKLLGIPRVENGILVGGNTNRNFPEGFRGGSGTGRGGGGGGSSSSSMSAEEARRTAEALRRAQAEQARKDAAIKKQREQAEARKRELERQRENVQKLKELSTIQERQEFLRESQQRFKIELEQKRDKEFEEKTAGRFTGSEVKSFKGTPQEEIFFERGREIGRLQLDESGSPISSTTSRPSTIRFERGGQTTRKVKFTDEGAEIINLDKEVQRAIPEQLTGQDLALLQGVRLITAKEAERLGVEQKQVSEGDSISAIERSAQKSISRAEFLLGGKEAVGKSGTTFIKSKRQFAPSGEEIFSGKASALVKPFDYKPIVSSVKSVTKDTFSAGKEIKNIIKSEKEYDKSISFGLIKSPLIDIDVEGDTKAKAIAEVIEKTKISRAGRSFVEAQNPKDVEGAINLGSTIALATGLSFGIKGASFVGRTFLPKAVFNVGKTIGITGGAVLTGAYALDVKKSIKQAKTLEEKSFIVGKATQEAILFGGGFKLGSKIGGKSKAFKFLEDAPELKFIKGKEITKVLTNKYKINIPKLSASKIDEAKYAKILKQQKGRVFEKEIIGTGKFKLDIKETRDVGKFRKNIKEFSGEGLLTDKTYSEILNIDKRYSRKIYIDLLTGKGEIKILRKGFRGKVKEVGKRKIKTDDIIGGEIKKQKLPSIKEEAQYKPELDIYEIVSSRGKKRKLIKQETGEEFISPEFKDIPSKKISAKIDKDIVTQKDLEKGIFTLTEQEVSFKDLIQVGQRKGKFRIKKDNEFINLQARKSQTIEVGIPKEKDLALIRKQAGKSIEFKKISPNVMRDIEQGVRRSFVQVQIKPSSKMIKKNLKQNILQKKIKEQKVSSVIKEIRKMQRDATRQARKKKVSQIADKGKKQFLQFKDDLGESARGGLSALRKMKTKVFVEPATKYMKKYKPVESVKIPQFKQIGRVGTGIAFKTATSLGVASATRQALRQDTKQLTKQLTRQQTKQVSRQDTKQLLKQATRQKMKSKKISRQKVLTQIYEIPKPPKTRRYTTTQKIIPKAPKMFKFEFPTSKQLGISDKELMGKDIKILTQGFTAKALGLKKLRVI